MEMLDWFNHSVMCVHILKHHIVPDKYKQLLFVNNLKKETDSLKKINPSLCFIIGSFTVTPLAGDTGSDIIGFNLALS